MLNSFAESGKLSGFLQYILLCAIIAGVIQVIIWLLRLVKLIRLIPQSAMYGFVNGLAIVITLAHIPLFHGEEITMYALVDLIMLIVYFLPKFTDKILSGLVASITITAIVVVFKL